MQFRSLAPNSQAHLLSETRRQKAPGDPSDPQGRKVIGHVTRSGQNKANRLEHRTSETSASFQLTHLSPAGAAFGLLRLRSSACHAHSVRAAAQGTRHRLKRTRHSYGMAYPE